VQTFDLRTPLLLGFLTFKVPSSESPASRTDHHQALRADPIRGCGSERFPRPIAGSGPDQGALGNAGACGPVGADGTRGSPPRRSAWADLPAAVDPRPAGARGV
jgi:hypothetical protein